MANRYWVGGSGTWNTVSTTNWSTTSGGAGGASVPGEFDSVFFDRTGPYTVTLTGNLFCNDITVSVGVVTFANGTSPFLGVYGSMTLLAGTVWSTTAEVSFRASTSGKTITTNGVSISGKVGFASSSGSWTLGSALNARQVTLGSGTVNTSASNYAVTIGVDGFSQSSGTLTLNASTVTCSGGWSVSGGTFNAGTSTINLSASFITFYGGGKTYSTVSFTRTASNAIVVIYDVNTFTNLSFPAKTPTGVRPINFGANQTITGTFTVTAGANATIRTAVFSDTFGTTRTLTCAAVSLTDVDFRDITIAGAAAPASGTRLGNCYGNSGITFTASKTVYWNLAGTNAWEATAWASTSGGAPAANNFPLAQDTAVINNAGAATQINFAQTYYMPAINASSRTTAVAISVDSGVEMYGSLTSGSGCSFPGGSSITFAGRTTLTLTSAGKVFGNPFIINNLTGTVTLQDALTTSSSNLFAINLGSGTFNANGFNVTLSGASSAVYIGGSVTRTLNVGAGTWSIAGSNPNWAWTTDGGTSLTVLGAGTVSFTSSSSKLFIGGGLSYPFTLNQGGAGALTIQSSNTFNNITNTYGSTGATSIRFTAGTTNTFTNWNASGTSGKLLTISSDTAASHTLSKSTGTVNANYLSLSYSTATGGATWNATDSVNGGNNTGWNFISSVLPSSMLMFFN